MATLSRPKRWDTPFSPDMTDEEVQKLLEFKEIAAIDKEKFPASTPLEGILKNDARTVNYQSGDIVIREGDYGNSAFLILSGDLRVVLSPGLPDEMLGRTKIKKKSFLEALSQLWKKTIIPEVRDTERYRDRSLRRGSDSSTAQVFLQDVPAVLDSNKTATLGPGALFGELAALGRLPRTSSVFAETSATVLEIRWQGLRELRKYDDGWREAIDKRYRENALNAFLRATQLFSHLNDDTLQAVADTALFETHGKFDWHVTYNKMKDLDNASVIKEEPVIASEGDYPDGLLMIRAGFARVSVKKGNGRQTLTYLKAGDYYGDDELYRAWKGEENVSLKVTITALGYVDVLRVPSNSIEEHLFSHWEASNEKDVAPLDTELFDQTLADGSLREWTVQERFINGTQTMMINLDRCVRCDDCVRACSDTHQGNPRFIRHGKTFDHWMVANACMHCADPVCMIGCPTGAIHRDLSGGMVIINDDTCIGCETCANSCPYSNIRMAEIRDSEGRFVVDPENQKPILKATKCDLCAGQRMGPACVFACPHEALKRVDFREAFSGVFEGK